MEKPVILGDVIKKTFILCLLFCCQVQAKVNIAASIMPLADWARNIGGTNVAVTTILKPGESPHTFTPRPSQMIMLKKADLFIEVGLGLEFWAGKMVSAADNPKLVTLVLGGLVSTNKADRHEGGVNPHVWLSPRLAVLFCEAIRDRLCEIDPARAGQYRKNYERYAGILRALDSEIRARIGAWRTKEFVCFHPAYVYFERDYGLRHVAIEEIPSRSPSPSELAAVVDEVRRIRARAVFVEPQLDPKVGWTVAKETGASVEILDPEGGFPDRDTYIKLMRFNLGQMEKALK